MTPDRTELLDVAKLSFLTGMTAGINLTATAFQSALANLDHKDIALRFVQLCDDWAVILNERLDMPNNDWSHVQSDLQRMRLEDALNRAKSVFFARD